MLTTEHLAESYRRGMTFDEIADCTGVPRQTVQKRLIRAGVTPRPAHVRTNEAQRAHIGRLIDTGMDFAEIARKTGCSPGLVARVARSKGW